MTYLSTRAVPTPSETPSPGHGMLATPEIERDEPHNDFPITGGHKASLLFKLPAELRNDIYRQVLVRGGSIQLTHGKPTSTRSSLLRTCRAIYEEAGSIYFGENGFTLTVIDKNLGFPAFKKAMRHFFSGGWKGRQRSLNYCFLLSGMSPDKRQAWMAEHGVYEKWTPRTNVRSTGPGQT